MTFKKSRVTISSRAIAFFSSFKSISYIHFLSLNPLTPKSDYHLISPYNITPESHIEVMGIKEMITMQRSF